MEEEYCSNCSLYDQFNYTNYRNITKNDIDIFYFYQSAQLSILGLLLVTIVAGNATLVLALLLTKSRKSRINFFIMQLAIADLLVGFINVLPDLVQKITITWLADSITCKILNYLQGVVAYSSTYVLVALSVDRCDAITHPMNFTGSWNRAKMLVVGAWTISLFLSVPLLIFCDVNEVQGQTQCWMQLESPQHWQIWITMVSIMIFVLPALTIAACYAAIVFTIWTIGQVESNPHSQRASSRGLIPRAKIKSVKMTFVIVFVFVICWSPYFVFNLLQVYDYIPLTQTNVAIATFLQSLAPLNSAANPVICWMFSPHIYTSLRQVPIFNWLWCGRCLKRHTREPDQSSSDSTAKSNFLSLTNARESHSVATMLNHTTSGSVSRLSAVHNDTRDTKLIVLVSAHE